MPVLAVSAPAIAGLGVLYVLLFLFLGIKSIRNGHWIMFLVGIPNPAVLGDRRSHAADAEIAQRARRLAGAGREPGRARTPATW
jgi:hypothetical protein